MRSGHPIWRYANVVPARLKDPPHFTKLVCRIIGMEMLEQLIGICEIDNFAWQWYSGSATMQEGEIRWSSAEVDQSFGNIKTVSYSHLLCCLEADRGVATADFKKDGIAV